MFRLYIVNNCDSCDRVIAYPETNGIDCKIVTYEDEKPVMPIFIFPALFYNDRLIAYGDDIITYFNNIKANG